MSTAKDGPATAAGTLGQVAVQQDLQTVRWEQRRYLVQGRQGGLPRLGRPGLLQALLRPVHAKELQEVLQNLLGSCLA